jgi:type VI secretion system protein ImpC
MSRDPRAEVQLTTQFEAAPARAIDEGTFVIAVLGDFAGRRAREAARPAVPLSRRPSWRIDRDDVDAVMARIGPTLHLEIVPGESPVTLRFESLDDFHPDRLVQRVSALQQLLELREQTSPPRKQSSPPAPREKDSRAADAAALTLGSGSLLDRIVDNQVGGDSAPMLSGAAAPDDLSDFVDRAVRGHVVPETPADAQALVQKIDGVIEATLRVVLHHPDFQALEALWRGVDFLVKRLDTDESLRILLIDVTKDELTMAADAPGGDGPWSLLVSTDTFGPADIATLGRLAALARRLGAPLIAMADSRLGGTESLVQDPDPDDWTLPETDEWNALRRSEDAAFVSLMLPRFLLRLPYGKRTDPTTMKFEEVDDGPPEHASYLWGASSILGALAIGESIAAGEPPATQATVDRLPLHVYTADGEATAKPCAEVLLSYDAVTRLLDRGLTPVASARDGDAIRIARLQSVASPARPLAVPARSRAE